MEAVVEFALGQNLTRHAHEPKGQRFWYLRVLNASRCSEIRWAQNWNGRKMTASCKESGRRVCQDGFSWSGLCSENKSGAVGLTAQDNVKGMETYTITVPSFAERSQCCSLSHGRARQQITVFQSVKSTPTECMCVYKTLIRAQIHCGANTVWFPALYDTYLQKD